NLFAYTGGFTLAAALGGAEATVTVDAAASACRWAGRNLVLNGFAAGEAHRIVRADAFDYLRRAARKSERYGLVVCDPPGFATVGRKRWSAERDLAELVALCRAVLPPGGEMLVTVNLHSMPEKAFAAAVAEGLGPSAGFATYPPPRDFPLAGGRAHLKTAWARAT
ncbi:MAG: class I SAM-dependent methyltransferase, partial [Candidatus Methylomirabilis sp.]|nr:class I SAM-dependent methyltransferase [Deltaproteobacteria bacterium]